MARKEAISKTINKNGRNTYVLASLQKNSSCLLGANSASNKTKPRHGKIKHHVKLMFILFFTKRYLLSNRIQNSTA